ncbi:uncharacterized protein OCT59_013343 [Rhizophagus irregularis]|uniref:uncharacterized protein n=1 Tax=Rhizophagus irregularis TaxID=588596 RepID=UPI0019EED29B|nr:hypothetical protein OCT59_013343 [Rhizophagus irregularis]GET53630.1 hypothetical protein GLOIN_2v1713848 [Rhizophagus irregularis DAOM 181602=DAOM 197198]CAB4491046.1 unnamed protein product [Rhizophagus irregularis]CAB5205112.1 unnamed protein product [Rhizophagus irregularis]
MPMEVLMLDEVVNHCPDLAKKYLGKRVFCSGSDDNSINLLKDIEIRIIDKNKSVILKCNGEAVGVVIMVLKCFIQLHNVLLNRFWTMAELLL